MLASTLALPLLSCVRSDKVRNLSEQWVPHLYIRFHNANSPVGIMDVKELVDVLAHGSAQSPGLFFFFF